MESNQNEKDVAVLRGRKWQRRCAKLPQKSAKWRRACAKKFHPSQTNRPSPQLRTLRDYDKVMWNSSFEKGKEDQLYKMR